MGKKSRKTPGLKPREKARIIATKISVACNAGLAEVDEATQETLADAIKRRAGHFLRHGQMGHVWVALATWLRDTTEGRPSQRVLIDDFSKRAQEASSDVRQFAMKHGRWPTERETDYFKENGAWPEVLDEADD
jgi:hypothetical protein